MLFEVKQHQYKLVLEWVTVPWVVLHIDQSDINQEVKQHKYKLVLGWVTVPWVVLLIDRSRINQEAHAGTLLCYDHDLSLIPGL